MLAHLSIFVRYSTVWKSWDTHRAEAESVRLLYSLSTEFTKYASRIYDCSQILKFAPTPDKLVLKHAYFCRVRYCQCASGEGLYYGGRSCFSSYQQSKKSTLLIVGCFLPLLSKSPVTELRDTLKAMNSAWQRLAQTKRFKGVVKRLYSHNWSYKG